jgi:acetoin utilization deacetylase AcuC-like enzyme
MSFCLLSHDDCLHHRNRPEHAEQPERLSHLQATLSKAGFDIDRGAATASDDELRLAHTDAYLNQLEEQAPQNDTFVELDADTGLNKHSLSAARQASGCVLEGLRRIQRGDCQRAFALTRPPGHHAAGDKAAGFCLFNHIAIAALKAQQLGYERVAIVDFDVHHGDGSEAILAGRPGIALHSSFQHPLYPFTGVPASAENIDNYPLDADTGGERLPALLQHWQQKIAAFAPQLLLVSAGFDAHRDDPLAQLNWLEDDYTMIGRWLRQQADAHCDGRLLGVLEGGYQVDALCRSVRAFLDTWR